MELNQGNLTLDKGSAVPWRDLFCWVRCLSALLKNLLKWFWNSLLWTVLLPVPKQLKLHWKGALEVLKYAQSSAGDWQGKKRQSPQARTWGSFSHSLKITQMMLTVRIRPTKPSNTSGLFIEDYNAFRSPFQYINIGFGAVMEWQIKYWGVCHISVQSRLTFHVKNYMLQTVAIIFCTNNLSLLCLLYSDLNFYWKYKYLCRSPNQIKQTYWVGSIID